MNYCEIGTTGGQTFTVEGTRAEVVSLWNEYPEERFVELQVLGEAGTTLFARQHITRVSSLTESEQAA